MNRFSLKRKVISTLLVSVGGTVVFAFVNIYKGNEKFYKNYVMPFMHYLDPEKAHELAIFISKHRLLPKTKYEDSDLLKIELFDKKLSNPIGLAAGFDKHADAIIGLYNVGFGFIEVGSVTPKPQVGNEKPRVFRLSHDRAIINRYGFNSVGYNEVFKKLDVIRNKHNLNYPIGVNLGKNKRSTDPINDYVQGINKFGPVSDYLVINISSPNTPQLRDMQTKVALTVLLKTVVEARNKLPQKHKPQLLLKLAPDLSYEERKDIAEVLKLKSCKIDGLIISNTTVERPAALIDRNKIETGGLSGHPLKDMSTKMIADMYKLTDGMTIIGVGGIFTGKDAYEKIKAGSSAVQLFTSMIYEGPFIVNKIKHELSELLIADGYKNISEAIGKGVS